MDKPILMVSNSEIGQFQSCRRKWHLSSFNRRNLIPRNPNFKFWIGTAGHYALERWHGYGEDPIRAFEQWTSTEIARIREDIGTRGDTKFWNTLEDLVRLGKGVLQHYVVYAEKYILPLYKFLAVELEFSVPIPDCQIYLTNAITGDWEEWVLEEWGSDPFGNAQFQKFYMDRQFVYEDDKGGYWVPPLYVGRLDALVQDQNEEVWVMDHKFMGTLVDPEMLLIDNQTARYTWAANIYLQEGWWRDQLGELKGPARGAIYNVIRKKVPADPKILKDGSMSKDKSVDTTYEHFMRSLIQYGENPADYREVLNTLKEKGDRFHQHLKVFRGTDELLALERRIGYEYRDLANVAATARDISHPALYPSPTMDCRWKCSYKNICYIANFGGDVETVVESTMMKQKRTDLYASQLEETPE